MAPLSCRRNRRPEAGDRARSGGGACPYWRRVTLREEQGISVPVPTIHRILQRRGPAPPRIYISRAIKLDESNHTVYMWHQVGRFFLAGYGRQG